MRICLVYDCMYPYTVGGAERWYRNLAVRLAAEGHDVTYVTLRQWDEEPRLPGVRVIAVAPGMELYVKGRRRMMPPVVFGLGVLAHLLRRGRGYDVVHTASFPYFSLLAAGALRRVLGYRLVVDWHEFWTRDYWKEYLGPLGRVGWIVQRACLRFPQQAFCFSRLHARRLEENGVHGVVTPLEGEYDGPTAASTPQPAEPVVVFAGRHIPEKRLPALVPAVAVAREQIPGLRAEVYGDGPDRPELLRLIREHGLEEVMTAPGFVDEEVLDHALRHALCFVLPSQREGYGLVVVESSAKGIPSVVASGPDNAAVELVDDGENGFVAASASPADLAAAIVRVHQAGEPLRESTASWFERNAERLSLASSLRTVAASYEDR